MPRNRRNNRVGRFQQNTKMMRQNATPGRFQVYSSAGKQLMQDVLYLKSLINSEMHFYNTNLSHFPTTAGLVTHLSSISIGDDADKRTGDYVLPRYLEFRLRIIAGSTDCCLRMVVFRWNQATTPAVLSVLEALRTTSFYTRKYQGSHGDTGVFDILCDKTWTVSDQWQPVLLPIFDCEINNPKSPPRHIHFDGISTTDPIGGLYYILISDDAAGLTQVSVEARLHYLDN